MNKVTLLMGRGIEGCGVTKFTLEQIKWLKSNGYEYAAFAPKEKTWQRRKVHDFSDIDEIEFTDDSNVRRIIEACDSSDAVIINSLPSVNHVQETIDAFSRIVDTTKAPIVLVQHDHSGLSIRRNMCMEQTINKAVAIFSHSRENDFAAVVEELTDTGGLSAFFGDDDEDSKNAEILNFQPGMDFDTVRDRYWKPIDEQDPLHNKWIGRTVTWKGYRELFQFHDNYLRPNGYLTTMEGIEKSPAFIPFKENKFGEWEGQVTRKNAIDEWELIPGNRMYIFGPYRNHEMLERMSFCGFGYQLSALKPRFIERSIEYTHCEVVCTGTIPVFRESYGRQCVHRRTGDPLIEHEDSGTVWLPDETKDMQKAFDRIDFLAKNPSARDETREKAYEFYKSHQDSEHTFKEMMDQMEERIK